MQMIEFNMVSKSDFEKFQSSVYHRFEHLNERISGLDQKMDERINMLDQKINERIKRSSLQLTVKLGVMLAVAIGLISTILAIKL